jgi:hypothetical protein
LPLVLFCPHAQTRARTCAASEQGIPSAEAPVAKGNRILGLDVNPPQDGDFPRAFDLAKSTGMQVVSLSLDWDDIETAPGKYDFHLLAIANAFYPAHHVALDLFIRPVDTNGEHLPKDLQGRALDSPIVIERFNKMIDKALAQIPALHLNLLSIGNEVDLGLGQDEKPWKEYDTFFRETRDHVKSVRTGVKVGCSATLYGLIGKAKERMRLINGLSDIVIVTYYPINEDFTVKSPQIVPQEIDQVIRVYPNQTIYFSEIGYPSSPVLGSSEEKQKEFIDEVFKAWDQNATQIPYVSFTWLSDLPMSTVAHFTEYYHLKDNKFQEYLRTLGLRTYEGHGVDKPAFVELTWQAKARGW